MTGVLSKIKKRQQGVKRHCKKDVNNVSEINLDHYSALPLQEEEQDDGVDEDLGDLQDDDDEEEIENSALAQSRTAPPLWVLPLYSLLPSHRQQKVFAPPPEGSRLVWCT